MKNFANNFFTVVKTFTLITTIVFSSAFSQVVINEIMYNPIHSDGSTNDDGEFVELLNIGADLVNIGGWSFSQGWEYTFPSGSDIAPGEFLVVGRDSLEFFTQHGFYYEHEVTNGALGNSGEDIVLVNDFGVTVDSVDYDDNSTWYADLTDGIGHSLELIDPNSDNTDPANWKASEAIGGTPGAANSTPPLPDSVLVTFQVDMSEVDSISADGVFLAGGGFGQDGHQLFDTDGDSIYVVTIPLVPGSEHKYKFRNQPSYGTWDGFEPVDNIVAGGCNFGEYNDRQVTVGNADMVIPVVCYGSCFTCDYEIPEVNVTFQVDMSEVDSISADGVFVAGGLLGQDGHQLFDTDGDSIYTVTIPLAAGLTLTYKFRNQPSYGTWDGFEDANTLNAEGCGFGDYNDRQVIVGNTDMVIPVVCYGSCFTCDYVSEILPVTVLFQLDMTDEIVNYEGVYMAGGTIGNPGDFPMEDHNGDGVYEREFELMPNVDYMFTYLNGNCGDYSCKENIGGQSCATGQWSDRSVSITQDTIISHKFSDCDATYSDSVFVQFHLDMGDNVVSDAGLFLAGGNYFGGPWEGRYPFTQPDSTVNMWMLADSFPANLKDAYTYVNGTDWGSKENIAGQLCAFGQYSDREFGTTIVDRVVNHCFGLCGEGACDAIGAPDTVSVKFVVDMNDAGPISPDGVHLASGPFGPPWEDNFRMVDVNGDGVFEIDVELIDGSMFDYTFTNGMDWGLKEDIVGQSCAVDPYSDRRTTINGDSTIVHKFGDCDATYSDSVFLEITLDMGDNIVSPVGLFLAGGNYFGGPWEQRYPFTLLDSSQNVWFLADSFPAFLDDAYTYVNGDWWDFKEDISGQACSYGQYNDRFAYTTMVDMEIHHCFGVCGDGPCGFLEQQNVVINEIMYNPIHSDGSTNDDGEFLELLNIGDDYVNLSGWSFSRGWEFTFPSGSYIFPGEHVIIGRDSTEFYTQHGYYFKYERFAGALSNSGEAIVLVNADGAVIDSVDYEDNSDGWSDLADGTGPSLELIDPFGDNNVVENWQVSYVIGGTPGYPNSVEPPPTPEPVTYSNYDLMLIDEASYLDSTVGTLPAFDVETGTNIVIKADFGTVANDSTLSDSAVTAGPYVGALGVYWDANFNGLLDSSDFDIVAFFGEGGSGVINLVDNGPNDMDSEVGKYASVQDFDFLTTQGATFLFAEIDDSLNITSTLSVQPYSSSSTRFSGTATMNGDDSDSVSAIFVEVEKLYSFNNGYDYDYDFVADGITGPNGVYDIGAGSLSGGDTVAVFPYTGPDLGRNYPSIIDEYGNYGNETEFLVTDGGTHVADILVMKLDALVQGHVLDQNGVPLSGYVYAFSEIDSMLYIESESPVRPDGSYQFWAMNGTEVFIYFEADDDNYIDDALVLDGGVFDEGLGAYVYNYDIQSTPPFAMVQGYAFAEMWNEENMVMDTTYLSGVEVSIYNENSYFSVHTNESGRFMLHVPVEEYGTFYFVSASDVPGFTNNMWLLEDLFYEGSFYEYHIRYERVIPRYIVSGTIFDQNGMPVPAYVSISSAQDSLGNVHHGPDFFFDDTFTDSSGFYSLEVPEGNYDIRVESDGFFFEWMYNIEAISDLSIDFTLTPIGNFTGSVQGIVTLIGNGELDHQTSGSIFIDVSSEVYQTYTFADDNGFYSIDLIDGVYDMYVDAPGHMSFYMENAFEISGNTVTYDIELFEEGYAGAPVIVDLHDVPNDQGRQMRTVWDAGMPGSWQYFTQFSIWRKVVDAPVDLWDYIETVPWHGMDPYAAVVPTLGDSSMHGMHMSTFMVTAHTEDVDFWLDSEPMSGYSVDNLVPTAPMSLSFVSSPGSVSLNWSGPVDEDFNYFNVYRQDILTDEPAMIFTTTDSFFVDQQLEDNGAFEYWVTAVDLSGLESESSGSVSAVLSAKDEVGLPTEFALKQNYPNPFNPSTQIQYALPNESSVVISIYDITGRLVRTLVNEFQSPGYRTVTWNATNDMGRPVSAGMYIYSIHAGDFIQNRKMILMK